MQDALVAEFVVSEQEVEEDLLTLIEQVKEVGTIQEVSSQL